MIETKVFMGRLGRALGLEALLMQIGLLQGKKKNYVKGLGSFSFSPGTSRLPSLGNDPLYFW